MTVKIESFGYAESNLVSSSSLKKHVYEYAILLRNGILTCSQNHDLSKVTQITVRSAITSYNDP